MESPHYQTHCFQGKETYTSKEISGQPELWQQTYRKVVRQSDGIKKFLLSQNIKPQHDINVILTGAGTSAFIGEIVRYAFKKAGFNNTQAIPTTDLVTHFSEIVDRQTPLLLISFGRSGNSPESKATVDLANKYCDKVSHLIISCNKDGELSQNATGSNAYTFILPPKAEDKGLAMTGSFSSMVLAATLIADLPNIKKYETSVRQLAKLGNEILESFEDTLKAIAGKDFKRIIFLGDGPNLGCAREAHLKVQELSDGICVGKYDSFLGFRHGPKAVVDDHSLLVYFLSNRDDVYRYQRDLINQISNQNLGMHTIAVGSTDGAQKYVDTLLHLPESSTCHEHLLPIPYILIAQIIGYYKSEALNLDPDNPSKNGAISRVVKGVKIYD